jgi:Fe-S-cluster containining protein
MTLTEAAPPFDRTTCACPTCASCCHDQPGSCAPGDVERIAAHLHLPLRVALLRFWASPGALIANSATGVTARVGTITPRMQRGRCVFLDEQDRCTIHPVAPFGCAYFDTHMGAAEGQQRSLHLIRLQLTADYQSLRRTLPAATSHRPRSY